MKKIKNPEIRINFSWLFYDNISKQIAKYRGWDLRSGEEYEELTEEFRISWEQKEDVILTAMQEVSALTFYRSVIDITAAPSVIPKSEPLLIGFQDTPETVIDTITHELCHTLLCDNKIISIYGKNRTFMLGQEWAELFGIKNDFNALVHIPVFAICQKVFEDYLDDERFVQRDRKLMEKFGATSYLKAWDYVEKEGADVILEKLKKLYAEIAMKLEKKK